jgi:twitching motility two-component system response regulator PilH
MISSKEFELVNLKGVHGGDASEPYRSVLLAEDDPALRRYLEIVLQRAGYEVLSATDGLEAMKLLITRSFDVVVTDAMMPNLNGYELCRFIRSSRHLSQLPIVLLSGLDPKNAASETEQVNAFLAKPISPDSLVDCIAQLISGQ